MVHRWTISVPDETAERVLAELDYGDNRSEWIVDAITRKLDAENKPSGSNHPQVDTDSGHDQHPPTPSETDTTIVDIVDKVSASWDSDDRLEDRRAAARAVLEYAAKYNVDVVGKSTEEIKDIFVQQPVNGQNMETWWRQNIRPVLQEVGEYSRGRHGYVVSDFSI